MSARARSRVNPDPGTASLSGRGRLLPASGTGLNSVCDKPLTWRAPEGSETLCTNKSQFNSVIIQYINKGCWHANIVTCCLVRNNRVKWDPGVPTGSSWTNAVLASRMWARQKDDERSLDTWHPIILCLKEKYVRTSLSYNIWRQLSRKTSPLPHPSHLITARRHVRDSKRLSDGTEINLCKKVPSPLQHKVLSRSQTQVRQSNGTTSPLTQLMFPRSVSGRLMLCASTG